jgi:hypothetical protein
MDQYSSQAIKDRMQITDVLYYYCRGVDRHDKAALARVYWPDSFDDHIATKVSGPQFVMDVLVATADMRTSHHLTNILIEFVTPNMASAESYFIAQHEMHDETGALTYLMFGGRYIDRFEKRGEEWRLRERTLVLDFQQTHPAGAWTSNWLLQLNRRGARFPDDVLYQVVEPASV